jgi:hypothetical protein
VTRFFAAAILALALCAPATLGAQTLEEYDYENLEFRGLGVHLGYVFPMKVESTLALGVRADLGMLGPNVRIVSGLGFWSSHLKQSEVDRLSDQLVRVCQRQGSICPGSFDFGRIRFSDFSLDAEAHYLFDNTPLVVTPYAGAGLGVHFQNGSGEAINGTFIEDLLDAVAPAVNVVAGVQLPLGPAFHLFGEARYVLVSDVPYAALTAGGSWTFPTPAARMRR